MPQAFREKRYKTMNDTTKKRVLCAVSGGVDSAVSMLLLKNEGFEVVGATLLLCGNETEANDAKTLAASLGLSHILLDRKELFEKEVITSFAKNYADGLTPNPCVECNRHIKFGILCEYAKEKGFDLVATGHYARTDFSQKYGRKVIMKAQDPKKDQSYVLWQLTREQVEFALFPLGSLDKTQVRTVAEQNGFVNARKKDSQDICFVPDGKYGQIVEKTLGKSFDPGNFVTEDGKILGTHKGIIHYTVGQRKGLGLALPAPLYVKEKKVSSNEVVLCPEDRLFSSVLYAKNVNLQAFDSIDVPFRAKVKTRYSAKEAEASLSFENGLLKIEFDSPQRALTPGQSAVFYDDDGVLLGGGEII